MSEIKYWIITFRRLVRLNSGGDSECRFNALYFQVGLIKAIEELMLDSVIFFFFSILIRYMMLHDKRWKQETN